MALRGPNSLLPSLVTDYNTWNITLLHQKKNAEHIKKRVYTVPEDVKGLIDHSAYHSELAFVGSSYTWITQIRNPTRMLLYFLFVFFCYLITTVWADLKRDNYHMEQWEFYSFCQPQIWSNPLTCKKFCEGILSNCSETITVLPFIPMSYW